MINQNGHRTFVQTPPQPTCCGCGKSIDLKHEDTLVELVDRRWSQDRGMIRWHQNCFDHYLDEGEET
jgi:hypothetical protein